MPLLNNLKGMETKNFKPNLMTMSQIPHELRWDGEELSAWIWEWDVPKFREAIESYLNSEPAPSRLHVDGSLWLDLVPICEYYDIDPEDILARSW